MPKQFDNLSLDEIWALELLPSDGSWLNDPGKPSNTRLANLLIKYPTLIDTKVVCPDQGRRGVLFWCLTPEGVKSKSKWLLQHS
jgi:hypothetical protein